GPWPPTPDLFVLLMGVSAAVNGLVIIALPGQLSAPAYDLARPYLAGIGVLLLGSGLALGITQLHPGLPPAAGRAAHLLAAGAFFALLVAVPLPFGHWTGIVHFGGFGTLLAVLPWVRPHRRRVDPASLRTRLTLVLAATAALPLIVVVALAAELDERFIVAEALGRQRALAAALARDVADYVSLRRSAVAALAAHPGLLARDPREQRALLQAFSSAYLNTVAFSTYTADGEPIAWSDDRLLLRGPGFAAYDDARRTNQPSLDILIGPPIDRPVFAFGVPIRDAEGRYAGLALGVVELARIANLLARTSVGDGQIAYLVDGRGRVIVHPNGSLVGTLADYSIVPPVAKLLASGEEGSLSFPTPDGERLAGYAGVPALGWGVVAERSRAAALASDFAERDVIFGTLVLAVGIAAAIGMQVADRLTAPLSLLAGAAVRVASGNGTAALPRSNLAEVAHLTTAFAEMRDRLTARTAELESAADRYRRLAENALDIIYRYELKPVRGYSYVSPAATEIVGYTPEEHYADPDLPLKLAHPDDQSIIESLLAGRHVPSEYTARVRHRDGHEVWLERRLLPIYNRAGSLVAVEGIARDVTAQKQAEAERAALIQEQAARTAAEAVAANLRDVNERLVATSLRAVQLMEEAQGAQARIAGMLDSITDGFIAVDQEWRVTYANHQAAQLLGKAPEELISRRAPEVFPVHASALLYREAHRAVAEQVTVAFEAFYEPLNTWLEARIFPGQYGLSVYFRDITERRRAEEEHVRLVQEQAARAAAEAMQQRLVFLAEASTLLASSLDYETTLAGVTRQAVPFFADWCLVNIFDENQSLRHVQVAHADPAKEALLRELRRRYPPGPQRPHPAIRALRTGQPQFYPEVTDSLLEEIAQNDGHLELLRGLGARSAMWVPLLARERTLGVISFHVAGGDRRYGPADLLLAEEIARRAAIAVDNARLYHDAREAIGLRDDILFSVAHDLRNPLTIIKLYAQLLLRQLAQIGALEPEAITQGLTQIDGNATKMAALIQELLDTARLRIGQQIVLDRRATDLVALAREAAAEHQQEKQHRILVEATVPELVGTWDAARIERVLGNLLSNAVKYSPEAGEITVRIAGEETAAGRWAVLEVRDQGVGIPAVDLPHIFERFYRGTNVAGRIAGTGVGLAGARHIVERHGGTITVESVEGSGSTFTVRLPLDNGRPTPASRRGASAERL
ncbi:MAG: PAS domain S-box protein, partial [Chloroflexi bacterium]|nr:PAS domain S-box protein [Chloroflexota bacterium]